VSGPVTAYVGVGANLGFAHDAVRNALADLSDLPASEFIAASSVYSSAPIESSGPDYFNAVAALATTLTAAELLHLLFAIEKRYGRVRTERNAPRTLDLDLLLYGQEIIQTDELVVPHPRMAERAFVLAPLLELAPEAQIPGRGSASELLKACAHQVVQRLDP
jgi:2-amino-4-hydroxy-6-hydroxymethyldihydropteridine diphosphokinase